MQYFINVERQYIVSVSDSTSDAVEGNATYEQYQTVLSIIRTISKAPDGYTYCLRADTLEWELVEMPVVPVEDEEASATDYKNALSDLGVTVDEEEET